MILFIPCYLMLASWFENAGYCLGKLVMNISIFTNCDKVGILQNFALTTLSYKYGHFCILMHNGLTFILALVCMYVYTWTIYTVTEIGFKCVIRRVSTYAQEYRLILSHADFIDLTYLRNFPICKTSCIRIVVCISAYANIYLRLHFFRINLCINTCCNF